MKIELTAILILAALSSVLSQPSPIEVKFYPHPAYPIVAPKNMAWMARDPSEAQPGPYGGGSGGGALPWQRQ
jgi:hypothetical protein